MTVRFWTTISPQSQGLFLEAARSFSAWGGLICSRSLPRLRSTPERWRAIGGLRRHVEMAQSVLR